MGATGMYEKSELQTILEKVTSASLQLYGNRLNKIILYGSYVRGDYTTRSIAVCLIEG